MTVVNNEVDSTCKALYYEYKIVNLGLRISITCAFAANYFLKI